MSTNRRVDSRGFHTQLRNLVAVLPTTKIKSATNSARMRPAADKMNDLQSIAIVQLRLVPLCTGHNFAIEFNRHAISLHSQLLDELGQR